MEFIYLYNIYKRENKIFYHSLKERERLQIYSNYKTRKELKNRTLKRSSDLYLVRFHPPLKNDSSKIKKVNKN